MQKRETYGEIVRFARFEAYSFTKPMSHVEDAKHPFSKLRAHLALAVAELLKSAGP